MPSRLAVPKGNNYFAGDAFLASLLSVTVFMLVSKLSAHWCFEKSVSLNQCEVDEGIKNYKSTMMEQQALKLGDAVR